MDAVTIESSPATGSLSNWNILMAHLPPPVPSHVDCVMTTCIPRGRPDLRGPHGLGAVCGGGRLPEAGELGDQPQRGASGGHHREERVR